MGTASIRNWLSALLAALCLWTAALPAYAAESSGVRDLTEFLHQQVWDGRESFSLNLRDYGVTADGLDQARRALNERPDLFILEGWRWEYFGSSYRIYPTYNQEILSRYDEAKSVYTNGIRAIADLAGPDWSPLEKVLFLNDYLALHYQYHEQGTNGDAYRFLRDGEGTCNAYTMTVLAVMERLGVPCSYVRSESLNHIWNIVQIDGTWYHLDVTWNDPEMRSDYGARMENPSHVGHTYFLLSTDALRAANGGDHFARDDWEYGAYVSCTSARFDESFFQDAISGFVPVDGLWYFLSSNGLFVWDGQSSAPEALLSFPAWFQRRYPFVTFSGYATDSGLYRVGSKLYFNTSFNVLAYDLSNGTTELIRDHVNEGNVVNFVIRDGVMEYEVIDGRTSTPCSAAIDGYIPPDTPDTSSETVASGETGVSVETPASGETDTSDETGASDATDDSAEPGASPETDASDTRTAPGDAWSLPELPVPDSVRQFLRTAGLILRELWSVAQSYGVTRRHVLTAAAVLFVLSRLFRRRE